MRCSERPERRASYYEIFSRKGEQSVDRKDADKIALGKPEFFDPISGKPRDILVVGLPSYLTAEINGSQSGWSCILRREGDPQSYKLQGSGFGFGTPEAALEALKKLLKWEPVR